MERFKLLIKAYSLARWLAEVRRGFSLFVYLKQTRDYLLPKLISGEIRLKDAAKKLKEVL